MILKSFELKKFDLKIHNFYLFYGDNEGLKEETIYDLFEKNYLDKIQRYEEKEILDNKNNFFSSIFTKSFFDNEKLIIINRATDKIKDIIEEILEKKITDLTIVLNSGVLEKKSKLRNLFEKNNESICIAFYPDNNQVLSGIVNIFFRNQKIPISQESINVIVERCRGDRQNLSNELNKIENFIKDKKNISITIAKKGAKAKVVSLAEKNAKESLNRKLYETNNNKNLFEGISKKFNLKNNISLVEVYDNSHIQGTSSVGAMVTFGDEGFIKKRYRKFDIKTKNSEQDDYAMLGEVLNRRFKRAILKKENYLTFPDLLLIDGGKGQYSTAREALNELGLYDIPIIAIAKGKLRNSGNETFFYNEKIFKFEKNDPTLFFLQRLRDEAHRFVINAHRAKRQKGIRRSLLDQINGIGSIRKRALLNHFGSAKAVESASFDEIKSVEGVEEKVAKKIYNFFHE